jgi:hypothetical protein
MKQFLNKNLKSIGGLIIILIAFFVGRFYAPEKIKIEVKTVEVEKVVTKIQHKKVVIRENKDGSKETVIITDTKSDEKAKGKSETDTKEIVNGRKLNVSALAGTTFPLKAVFGVSANKQIL